MLLTITLHMNWIAKKISFSKHSIEYYECWGVPIIQKAANLVSGSPWIIPFFICCFKSEWKCLQNCCQHQQRYVHDRKYKVAIFTLHKNAHFTTVIFWHGSKCFYDGLQSSKNLTCLRPVKALDIKMAGKLICQMPFDLTEYVYSQVISNFTAVWMAIDGYY